MNERNFNMRLKCRYEGDANDIADLEVEHKVDNEWQLLDMGLAAPGFDIFVYSILTCQHLFFRLTCARRGLLLNSAEGSISIATDKDWHMETLRVHFSGRLGSGESTPGDVDVIVSQMKQCPVSRNLGDVPHAESTVRLN